MISLVYIGNNLVTHGRNLTSMGQLGPLLEQEGFFISYASSKTNKFQRLWDMLKTCVVNKKHANYVLIDTYSTLNFWYAFFVSQLCRFLKLSYIPILHGGNLESRLRTNPFLSRLIFKHAFVNIAPSVFIKDSFKRYGYSNLEYIPNTIKIDEYPFRQRPMDGANLIWVRSFSKIYNPQLAVRVLRRLSDKGVKATLCMVGPDSGDGSLKATKQLAKQLQVEVSFTGKLTKAEWIALSKDYNVFINTTHYDNMPVSVVEAMALGLPVVSTNVGGMPYLITHGKDGILVDPENEHEFVDAITYLMANPKAFNQMVEKARYKAESFDWCEIQSQWISILE
ncbi:glycosyltransferase family 4 protein [Aestuariivivens marinum]|uniref:glycosyltransferase family 4 protein n=1 Tax=Aestuariivivens marinum TaxID=2913555 RepID=UPI001F580E80|nr:glycosyltransferase family 4 protein [Aestuariivivens marinum]